jgi:hypothetical protein
LLSLGCRFGERALDGLPPERANPGRAGMVEANMRLQQQRVSAGLTIAYDEPVSAAYAKANLQAAKALHCSGLSLKERFDLVLNQMYFLMRTSPNGFAYEFGEVQKSLAKMPTVYVQDIEADILTNRKAHTPEPATKIDHTQLSPDGPMYSEIQADCARVVQRALGVLCPASGLSLLLMTLGCFAEDVVIDPDAFIDDVAIVVIKATMQNYRETKHLRLRN